MAKQVSIVFHGVRGYGANKTLARLDAQSRIEKMAAGWYTPTVYQWRGMTLVVYRQPDGWHYTIARQQVNCAAGQPERLCYQSGYDTKEEAEAAGLLHLAQNGWVPDDGTDLLEPVQNPVVPRARAAQLRQWQKWQLLVRQALSHGLTEEAARGCADRGEWYRGGGRSPPPPRRTSKLFLKKISRWACIVMQPCYTVSVGLNDAAKRKEIYNVHQPHLRPDASLRQPGPRLLCRHEGSDLPGPVPRCDGSRVGSGGPEAQPRPPLTSTLTN
jgi:hypothetical protein